jgi:alkaline phosphatase
MVPVYAIGAGSGHFSGKLDNTDIPKRIAALMGVEFSGLK